MRPEDVLEAARFALGWWNSTPDEAEANRYEEEVCRVWKNQLQRDFPEGLSFEVEPIPGSSRSRIDAVDYASGTAFEFKVSGKNPHHRFFRDLWKVVVFNSRGGSKIKKLVFLVGEPGASNLTDAFTNSVRQVIKTDLGFEVEIVSVRPSPAPSSAELYE